MTRGVLTVCALLGVAGAVVWALVGPSGEHQATAATEQLPEAVATGDFPRVAQLLQAGAEVDIVRPPLPDRPDRAADMGHSMLSLAVRLGHDDVARLLLRHGADPNGAVPGNARQPIFWAAYRLDDAIFDHLVESGADLEAIVNGKTALQHALPNYHNVATFLRRKGAADSGKP